MTLSVTESMSPVDQAWLEMDDPHSPMVVAAILEFTGVADAGRLGSRLMTRLLRLPRFRQHVEEHGGQRRWAEDELLRGYHLRIHALPKGHDEADLCAAVAHELEQPLDRARPLWRMVLFPGARRRVTLLFRAHHAMADGIALLRLLLGLRDGRPGAALPGAGGPAPHHGPLARLIAGLEDVNRALEALSTEVASDLRDPGRLRHQLDEARKGARAAVRVARLPDDNPRAFRAPLTGRRHVAWVRGLSLATVRRVAHRQHVTVNDVFLTALAGAFGRHLRTRGPLREDQNLRVSVPVNLRADGDGVFGNRFGLVLVDLPVGVEGWNARLDLVADRMAALKQSWEPRAVLGALWAAGHLPAAAERRLVNFIGHKAAAVVSNLPGPRETLRLGGARLRDVVFWPPQSAGIGIGVSLLSYAGRVSLGVSADAAHLPDPQALVRAFQQELASMAGRRGS